MECALCSRTYSPDGLIGTCLDDGKPLLPRYDLESASRSLQRDNMYTRVSSMWRYSEVMPVIDSEYIVSLGEGWTPLLAPEPLRALLDMPRLFVKDEGCNPTGSFKARGMSAALSRAAELGAREFTVPSAGNAAGALAAYAAAGGMKAHVFMPQDTPKANVVECKAYGADCTLVDGFITDAGKLSAKMALQRGWFDVSTLREPYRVEGKKSMGYEIVEQLGRVPDVIVYPTGGGTGIVGIWKALAELEMLGWIGEERPRMISVQAEGCAPIMRAFAAGAEFAEPFPNPSTIASGLRVPAAVGDFMVLRAVRESRGEVITVNDEEMIEGVKLLSCNSGIFAALEGGAVVYALRKLVASGAVNKDEVIVLLITGSGLKCLDSF